MLRNFSNTKVLGSNDTIHTGFHSGITKFGNYNLTKPRMGKKILDKIKNTIFE